MAIAVEYDEKRCGYWVRGDGFDFFAYFTAEISPEANAVGLYYLECDQVERVGDSRVLWLQVPLPVAKPDLQVVETLIVNKLQEQWGYVL